MKKTRIKVRAYCSDFDVEVTRKEYLSVADAECYVKKEIIDTGSVISVTLISELGELTLANSYYENPLSFKTSDSGLALQYLKMKA